MVATVAVPPDGVAVIPRGTPSDTRRVVVRARRFAPTYVKPATVLVKTGEGRLFDAAPDSAPRPWRLEVRTARPFNVCSGP